MFGTLSREKALFSAGVAVFLLFLGTASVRSETSSIHVLFTGGVTAHLEPSG
jgi:hypothetical protein